MMGKFTDSFMLKFLLMTNYRWLQSWEQELLAENELIAQVEAASLGGQAIETPPVTSHGKKKKAKKITLMSTTARRAA